MWQGILGHDDVVERFHKTLAANRLASTYLFIGPSGIGKRRFAIELAHALLCTESPEAALAPCGHCESCRLFAAGTHPDLEVVGLPKDKSTLPIDLFIGDKEHRNQEGLCHRLGMRPFFGRRKVAIVDDADHFSIPSANCLLKTLEEPPQSALLILIGTSPSRQLPTIRSRSQIVRFSALDRSTVAKILLVAGEATDPQWADQLAVLSEGSVDRARELADPELWKFRDQLLAAISGPRVDDVRLTRSIQAFVDEAGKEPAQKRLRLRSIIEFAIEHLRERIRGDLATADRTIGALDASLAALEYMERNVNVALITQWWCESISQSLCGAARRPLATMGPNT